MHMKMGMIVTMWTRNPRYSRCQLRGLRLRLPDHRHLPTSIPSPRISQKHKFMCLWMTALVSALWRHLARWRAQMLRPFRLVLMCIHRTKPRCWRRNEFPCYQCQHQRHQRLPRCSFPQLSLPCGQDIREPNLDLRVRSKILSRH